MKFLNYNGHIAANKSYVVERPVPVIKCYVIFVYDNKTKCLFFSYKKYKTTFGDEFQSNLQKDNVIFANEYFFLRCEINIAYSSNIYCSFDLCPLALWKQTQFIPKYFFF